MTQELIQVPKGWKMKKLMEISEVKRGISWSKLDESKIPVKDSIPVLRIGNVRERNLDLTNLIYLKNTITKNIDEHKVSKNDILLVGSNGNKKLVGRSCKISETMNFVYASFLMGIRKISDEIHPDFLFYYLNSPQGWNFIRNSTTTASSEAGIKNLKITSLREMPIIFPESIAIQKKIVQKLDQVLGKINEKRQVYIQLITNQKINLELLNKKNY